MTSVILVQHNGVALTRRAIGSFISFHSRGCEIILVDNASTEEGARELSSQFVAVRMLCNNENKGFSAANNQGAREAAGEFLLFLNNDTVTIEPFLDRVEQSFAADAKIGVVGPMLLNLDGSFQISSGPLPSLWRESVDKLWYRAVDHNLPFAATLAKTFHGKSREVGWVTGAALFIRRSLFFDLGGFDEAMFMYFEDKDICRRAGRAGWKVLYCAEARLLHLKAGSSSFQDSTSLNGAYRRSQIHYYKKHRRAVECLLLELYLRAARKFPG